VSARVLTRTPRFVFACVLTCISTSTSASASGTSFDLKYGSCRVRRISHRVGRCYPPPPSVGRPLGGRVVVRAVRPKPPPGLDLRTVLVPTTAATSRMTTPLACMEFVTNLLPSRRTVRLAATDVDVQEWFDGTRRRQVCGRRRGSGRQPQPEGPLWETGVFTVTTQTAAWSRSGRFRLR
jgi:hypothetical protein